MEKITRRGLIFSGAALAAGAFSSSAEAATGQISLRIVSAGFIFGVSGGQGLLVFQGVQTPLTIGGLSAGLTAGLAGTELVGTAQHLHTVGDIEGIYTRINANVAVAGGASVQRLRNARGVILTLHGRQVGFMFSIDLSGMELRLR